MQDELSLDIREMLSACGFELLRELAQHDDKKKEDTAKDKKGQAARRVGNGTRRHRWAGLRWARGRWAWASRRLEAALRGREKQHAPSDGRSRAHATA